MGAPDGLDASRLEHHVGQGVAGEVLAHVTADVGPHPKQDTLALVVTGTVLVGQTKVARDYRSVHGGDHLGQGDRFSRPR